jgi:hypothetical protein
MVKPWITTKSEVLDEYRIFRLRKDRCRSPRTLAEHDFFVLEMPDWCNVVALTPEDEVVFVRQYRFGISAATLEIPGGLVEETGFACETIVPLGRTLPNPAIQNNVCHTALALGCRLTAAPKLDEREDIEVEVRPLRDIPGLIAKGEISHALVIVAFHHYFTRPS